MPCSLAFDGDKLGHPLNQSKILAPKLEASLRDPLSTRVTLIESAKNISYKLVGQVLDKDYVIAGDGYV